MIDRLVHHAEVLTLTGDSYRTRARRELQRKTAAATDENTSTVSSGVALAVIFRSIWGVEAHSK